MSESDPLANLALIDDPEASRLLLIRMNNGNRRRINRRVAQDRRRAHIAIRQLYLQGKLPTPSPNPGGGSAKLSMAAIRKSGYLTLEKCRTIAKDKERSIIEGTPYGGPRTFRHQTYPFRNDPAWFAQKATEHATLPPHRPHQAPINQG